MKCKCAQKMLADYANRILKAEDSRLVQEHIAHCEPCRRELDMLGKVLELIDSVKVEYPPASVWDNFLPDLHRRIEREATLAFRKQQRRRFYLLPGWAATAVVVLLLLTSTILRDQPSVGPVQVQEAENTEMVEHSYPPASEDSYESLLVAGIISQVLITESEAAELKKVTSSLQSEIPTSPYYYYDDDHVLTDINDDASATEDDEGVIQYLENEFAEFDENPMFESDYSESGAI